MCAVCDSNNACLVCGEAVVVVVVAPPMPPMPLCGAHISELMERIVMMRETAPLN